LGHPVKGGVISEIGIKIEVMFYSNRRTAGIKQHETYRNNYAYAFHNSSTPQTHFNPEFAVAIYCGLQILAATLFYCFYHPVLLTGPQRETIGTFVPYLFHPPDETKLPVARVVVCDMILLLNIIMIMPAPHRQNALRQRRKACSEIRKLRTG
jgi:hypothetical protein